MLNGGVAACHFVRTFRCAEYTQQSEKYTHHTYDMLSHHCITCNDEVFTES